MPSVAAVCLLSSEVHAQGTPPFDPAIDVQLFDLAPGPRSFMSVGDASLSNKEQFSVDFLLTFLTDPFVIYNVDENADEIDSTRTDVVSSMFAGQLVGAYGLTDDLQLGLALPLVFSITGEGLDPSSGRMSSGGLQATGFGDLRVEAKGKLFRSGSIAAAWTGGLTVPTSFGAGGSDFLGDDLPGVRGGAAAHWNSSDGKLRVGGNLGVMLRKPRKIYNSEVGQQLAYGAGAAYKATDDFSIITELFGRTSLTTIDLDASPLELGAGLRAQATKSVSVTAGGGVGVLSGIGAPALRFVVSLGYAPDLGDTDNDGIGNMNDKCPLLAEDMDGFEDSDGCPDNDNDGDRREDSVDQCPNDREDIDGFEDEDGCPERDNDNDGILDGRDRCPLDAEDGKAPYIEDGCPAHKRDSDDDGVSDDMDACPDDYEDEDGFEDWDGCPEEDNDRDGIPDEDDSCPLCPEDADNFNDEDGCPDLDNDQDGVADSADQCPDEAEVINGISDEDGCPDRGGNAVASLEGNRLVLNTELTFSSKDMLRKKRNAISVARIMAKATQITKWRVVVVAKRQRAGDDATRAKSLAQANVLRDALIEGGVAADRIEAMGAVSDNPTVAIAAVDRAEADPASMVCPESLEVKAREQPAAPVPAAVPETTTAPVPSTVPEAATAAEAPTPAPADPAVAADSDADGVLDNADTCPDKAETANGYQDKDGCPDDVPKKLKGLTGSIKGIFFRKKSANFRSSTIKRLKEMALTLKKVPGIKIEVASHTDNEGDAAENKELSKKRADAVVNILVAAGAPADMFSTVGFGSERPIADNADAKGRKANRRIEFHVVGGQ